MKSLSPTIFCLILFCFISVSCSKEDDGIYFQEANDIVIEKSSYSGIEYEILNLVNNHRKTLNLPSLEVLNIVSGVANKHTNYMIEKGEPNHDNFASRSQLLSTKAKALSIGENVAYGYSSAEGAINGWLNSPAHRKVIENPNYTHFGISTEHDLKGRNYFTHIFISQ